ncbi:unnamed protein product [Spodoptera littoralis]|uniref:Uncharacterized protein n=1 Tax=Spodoptera littoralis TaxID=7109 RepID=A0A9P0IH69_SPOLI|nr:unnamed protein product [Spodoptera littoralis]CAH1645748.1 unnamed protein product [Spodoptera littoralis]
MSKKGLENIKPAVGEAVPFECPFREFRDNELQIDSWGLGPAALRVHNFVVKAAVKTSHEQQIWTDDQTQPLPRSAHHFLHGWIRAEELADDRWGAEVHIFEIEHQSEVFSCSFGQEGWRPKYHIYSPGMKPGGGPQHKPTLSKNGCYLVRLFYLGTWRCVWVSDYVPVDSNGAPLLPFSPLLTHPPGKPGSKQVPPAVISGRTCVTYVILMDTKDCPPYQLPGITPGHEMSLLVMMARDLPLKKPLPEPG